MPSGLVSYLVATTPFGDLVTTEVGDIIEVTSRLKGPFDGVVSSFAALNTVDLERFGAVAAGLLRPGGRAILHLLSPGWAER